MFGKEKIRTLEDNLSSLRRKIETMEKEKKALQDELAGVQKKYKNAQEEIQALQEQISHSELSEIKEQARHTVVEYEGLKALYQQKIQEVDASRESTEESFAREAATKRQALSEEMENNRQENRDRISDTVKTFAGSYRYYLDQVRALMDALSQAAQETGDALFRDEQQDIRESFGMRIVEKLRNDTDSLRQNTGDKLLIGTDEADDNKSSKVSALDCVTSDAENTDHYETEPNDFNTAAVDESAETVKTESEFVQNPLQENQES